MHGAETVGRFLRNINWDLTYASDLYRATHTALQLLSFNVALDKPLIQSSLIREKNFGVRENLDKDLSVEEARKVVAEQRGVPLEQVVDNAETAASVFKRQQDFFNTVRRDVFAPIGTEAVSPIQKNILCVSHGGFIYSLIQNLPKLGLTSSQYKLTKKIDNCSITLIKLEFQSLEDLIDYEKKCDIRLDAGLVNFVGHLERRAGDVLDKLIVSSLSTSLDDSEDCTAAEAELNVNAAATTQDQEAL